VAWTIGYDTIYAHQDREDDALIGMKSTALRFGPETRSWLTGFYGITAVAMGIAGWLAGAGWLFFAGLAFACGHLLWQIATLDIDDADNCLARFKSNRDFGLIVFFAILADMAVVSSP
jgi:4-hydroxybenzoate polyprenyltransferase